MLARRGDELFVRYVAEVHHAARARLVLQECRQFLRVPAPSSHEHELAVVAYVRR